MRQKIVSITRLLHLPVVCIICAKYHREPFAVCKVCINLFKPVHYPCQYCAAPLPDHNFLVCGNCVKKKPFFDRTIASYQFREPLRTLLHQFKYQGELYLCAFLTNLILNKLDSQALATECLVPVPLHPKRLRQRGFNQAAELAKSLARHLKIPCAVNLCKKILHTEPQVNLDSKLRQTNLRNAFKAKQTKYKHITLIDDLFTTGSTVNELAYVLKQQGVQQVNVWCCARTTKSNLKHDTGY